MTHSTTQHPSSGLGTAVGEAAPRSNTAGQPSEWRAFLPLTKPTISLLVVVTVVPALLMAARGIPDLWVVLAALLGTYLSSASASVFNHLLDSDLDSVMNRTRARPVPSGRVSATAAFLFGAALGIVSLLILYYFTTPLAAVVALSANAFYVLIYTLCLKRHTVQNIVIGGAAGAVGPLIGWAAVAGDLAWPAWVLFAIIFLWTPPHFWALALKYQRDYAAANVPMMPVVRGEETTRRQMFAYTLTLFPAVVSLTWFGEAGLIYLVISFAATAWFAWKAWVLLRTRSLAAAMPVFHYSCLYLFIVFGALTADRLLDAPALSSPLSEQRAAYVQAKQDVIVRFYAKVIEDLPVVVEPLEVGAKSRRDVPRKTSFRFSNLSDRKLRIRASHHVQPDLATPHFKKLACFCFDEQILAPRESKEMPVVYTIAPDLPAEVDTISLTYTVYPLPEKADGASH